MPGQPKTPFYIAMAVVIVGLVAFAVTRKGVKDVIAPPEKKIGNKEQKIDPGELGQKGEASDAASVTTVKEYSFKPAQRLPEIKGTSAYKPLEDNTVRFALNVWAGWGPIILANNGFKAGKVWKTQEGKEFKVDLVLSDDPIAMRNAYVAGELHIGWATLDMVPLFMEGFVQAKDSRVMPRIYQQIDWSNGGDGMVVRENIKSVADLRGKKMVMAQNSPSQYFALNMLVAGGVQPSEVEMVFTNTAFEAARAFEVQKDISAAVSWAPDIYKLSEIKGNRMLVNTQTANKLIADVWFARADFAKDNPDLIEALVRGIFDAMEDLKDQAKKQECSKLMSAGYDIPASDVMNMFGDAHSTNWAENYQFFLNQNNPTNFEHVWRQSYYLYKRIGSITHQAVPFDQVMDFSVIEKLGKDKKYSSQKNEYTITLAPKSVGEIKAESSEILTNTVMFHFFPNSWDLHKTVTKVVGGQTIEDFSADPATRKRRQDMKEVGGKTVEELYDPSVDLVLEEIAKLTEQFGAARVIIEGHTDSSMKGQVPASVVKELSLNRANAVKEALIEKYKLDPNKFSAEGMGWERPANPNEPENHAKNRRVEVKVYSAEKQ